MSAPCSICGGTAWQVHYKGPVRDGKFGTRMPGDGIVNRCQDCGAARLEGAPVNYESTEYRAAVDGKADMAGFRALHDPEQAGHLAQVGTADMFGKVVADVGCGGGRFLDLVRGLTQADTIAIEPAAQYHADLAARGHHVFPYADRAEAWKGKVDVATVFSTIEHVEDPRALLRSVAGLLKPGGRMLVTTPNRNDWLLELLPNEYAAFFFRRVHRWYFCADSLARAGERAGLAVQTVASYHRFDLSNMLLWMRDKRPTGSSAVPVPPVLDAAFKQSLAQNGRGDYLYAWFQKGAA